MSTLRVNLLEPYSGADVTLDADLTATGTLRHSGGAYVPQVILADGLQAATNIASVTDVTLATASVPSIAAGDVIVVEFEGTLLNNSGGDRIYTYRFAVGAFAVEGTNATLSTNANPRPVPLSRITIHVRATDDVTGLAAISTYDVALAGDAQTIVAFPTLMKWKASTTDDITGTQTATLSIRSDNATGTQEFRVFSARILRYAETP